MKPSVAVLIMYVICFLFGLAISQTPTSGRITIAQMSLAALGGLIVSGGVVLGLVLSEK